MTSKESRVYVCKPGYWLVNVAPLGETPDWQEQVMPPTQDPNAKQTLFGYEEREFLAKQYK